MAHATKSEYWPIERLKLWDKNPKGIKPERRAELKTRLERQGQTKPLLITENGVVIGGNQRLPLMIELGWKEVWVSVTKAKTNKEIFDLALTDNEEFGYYDKKALNDLALSLELTPLELGRYELSLGPTITLSGVMDDFAGAEEDNTPPLDRDYSHVRSELGGVYRLGEHRLMCGDATDYGVVTDLMDGAEADLVFTDPPYNVDYEGKTKQKLKIENDKKSDAEFLAFLETAFQNVHAVTKAGGAIYVCHADSEGLNFRKAFIDSGYQLKQCIIWVKQSMVMGRQDYQWQHEPILYGWKEGSHYFARDRSQTTVWYIDRPTRSEEHPTMKPVALVERAIRNSSRRGDIVLDIFGGSGSTLIAAHKLKRIAYILELDPRYCDVIRKRYAQMIGKGKEWESATPNLMASAV